MRRLLLGALAAAMLGAAAPAGVSERLPDPAQEARAHALFRQIRCVVCQNESIDDSQAELAGDLRGLVRQQIVQGRSDAEIRRFLTDRYGEFVLLKPRFSAANALLWLAPFAVVLGGLAVFALRRRATPVEGAARLTPEELARLESLDAKPGLVTVPPKSRPTIGSDMV